MQLGHEESEQAFLAGLLHDVGKLVLIANVPEEYDEVLAFAKSYRIPVTESEQRRFGATHAQIGAYLLALWGLQDEVIELVEYHHDLGSYPAESPSAAIALHAAQYLNPLDYRPDSLNRAFLSKHGCEEKIGACKEMLK